jgi:hypothetical protein
MPDSSPFYLFTSISPRLTAGELDYQKSCIASWRSAGFGVVTVNGHSEVTRIEAYQLDAEIVTVEEAGKPPISDILTCARARNLQYAGIINADCSLLPYPELAGHLAGVLRGRFVVVERLDVDDYFMPQPDSCSGFDAFFFDMAVIPTSFDRHFRISVPWWDYCFPMAAFAAGAEITAIETPLLTHRMHNPGWNGEERENVGQKFWSFLRDWRALNEMSFPSLGSEVDDFWPEEALTSDQLAVVGLACFRWLRSHRSASSQRFLPQRLWPIEALLHSQRIVLNQLNQKANSLRTELEAKESFFEDRLAEMRGRVNEIEKSTSWRVTKPLREIVRIFSRARP